MTVKDEEVDGYGTQVYFAIILGNNDQVFSRTFSNTSGGGTTTPFTDELVSKARLIKNVTPVVCTTTNGSAFQCDRGSTMYNPND